MSDPPLQLEHRPFFADPSPHAICRLCHPELVLYGELIPDYLLVRQPPDARPESWREGERELPPGWYGLTTDGETIDFRWPDRAVRSTWAGVSREEQDSWGEDDPRTLQQYRHVAVAALIAARLACDPVAGWCLVDSSEKAGYADENDVGLWIHWFTDRLATLIDLVEGPSPDAR